MTLLPGFEGERTLKLASASIRAVAGDYESFVFDKRWITRSMEDAVIVSDKIHQTG